MATRANGIVAKMLRGFTLVNPNVKGSRKMKRLPTDPERLMLILGGGHPKADPVKVVRPMYNTTNGAILKTASLIREYMGHVDTMPLEDVRKNLRKILHTLQGDDTLRQNANKGAGTFPNLKDSDRKAVKTYDPIPTPTAEQRAEWQAEHDRLTRDPMRRTSSGGARTVKRKVSQISEDTGW